MDGSQTPRPVQLRHEVREQLDACAAATNRSADDIANEAVAEYTAERLAYLSSLNEAIHQAKTQPSYSKDAIFDWLDGWGTDDAKPLGDPDLPPGQ